MKQKLLLLAAGLLLALSFAACAVLGGASSPTPSPVPTPNLNLFVTGTTVGGVDISGKTVAAAAELCETSLAQKLKKVKVKVNIEEDTVEITGSDIGHTTVVEELLAQVLKTRKPGAYPLEYAVNASEVEKLLAATAEEHTVEAKDSTVENFDASSETFSFSEEVDGKAVNLSATAQAATALLAKGTSGTVDAVVRAEPAKVTAADLEAKFTRLATYSTVSTNNENGNHNMALSFERINGTALNHGEEFSFNRIVGDSTYDGSGFLPAGGLVGGVLVPLYGGGICQSSSTIYGAALLAGMEISLRDCHSSPSTYVPIGLDATVSYDDLDFRFVNPYETPVYVVAYMNDVTLTVSIYGCQPEEWDSIEVNSWENGREPIPEGVRYLTDESLATGEYYVKSYGNEGIYAGAERNFYKEGELVKREELLSSYYGSMRKTYMVGPGTDTTKVTGESGNTNTKAG